MRQRLSTGALTVKSEVDQVWDLLADAKKTVIVQIAPAVRVGLGECFGLKRERLPLAALSLP